MSWNTQMYAKLIWVCYHINGLDDLSKFWYGSQCCDINTCNYTGYTSKNFNNSMLVTSLVS